MSENKTVPTNASVTEFLEAVESPVKRDDSFILLELMKEITGEDPVMWGPGIVGFGKYHYKYDTGREGDMLLTGFSPRKQNMVLYVGAGSERVKPLLKGLGRYRTGKSCLYINKLADVDMDRLADIISSSYEYYKNKYNTNS